MQQISSLDEHFIWATNQPVKSTKRLLRQALAVIAMVGVVCASFVAISSLSSEQDTHSNLDTRTTLFSLDSEGTTAGAVEVFLQEGYVGSLARLG